MRSKAWGQNMTIVLYVIALIVVVVGVDILFLRHSFGVRLIVNIGIVLVFGALYMRFLKRP
jgi:type IV secretory pathway VirB2 component (pilin)